MFQRIKIIQNIFSDHADIKLEISDGKISRKIFKYQKLSNHLQINHL